MGCSSTAPSPRLPLPITDAQQIDNSPGQTLKTQWQLLQIPSILKFVFILLFAFMQNSSDNSCLGNSNVELLLVKYTEIINLQSVLCRLCCPKPLLISLLQELSPIVMQDGPFLFYRLYLLVGTLFLLLCWIKCKFRIRLMLLICFFIFASRLSRLLEHS